MGLSAGPSDRSAALERDGVGCLIGVLAISVVVGLYVALAVYNGWWVPKTNSERDDELNLRIGEVLQISAPFKVTESSSTVP